MPSLRDALNGLSQEIVPNLRIFTENWILRLQKADFDDLYTIGSEFASPTRSHTPFPAVSAKNAVSENFYCQILRKFSENSGLFFAKIHYAGQLLGYAVNFCSPTTYLWGKTSGTSTWPRPICFVAKLLHHVTF